MWRKLSLLQRTCCKLICTIRLCTEESVTFRCLVQIKIVLFLAMLNSVFGMVSEVVHFAAALCQLYVDCVFLLLLESFFFCVISHFIFLTMLLYNSSQTILENYTRLIICDELDINSVDKRI